MLVRLSVSVCWRLQRKSQDLRSYFVDAALGFLCMGGCVQSPGASQSLPGLSRASCGVNTKSAFSYSLNTASLLLIQGSLISAEV